ncbi:gamma-glutamyl-gamma-aminobutyrate hydrolase family protein [Micromonospora sp. NPDC006766]|uniref:type 1 glutamine amidotransferase n=1 Tax=Micromonospora sp. NPDC006766 TaxID=3154778 RepID=UPI0034023F67
MRTLLVGHDHTSRPGFVGEYLRACGHEATRFMVVPEERFDSPSVSVTFPDPTEWDAVICFGAPWSVYDTDRIDPWITSELTFLRAAHASEVPVLGICFGAQALAAALGGGVERAPRTELGWTVIDSDEPELIPPGPWLESHSDRCILPPDAREIARTEVGPQAFSIGRSLGLQFHPEATADLLAEWMAVGGAAHARQIGVDPDALIAETSTREAVARTEAFRLMDHFLQDFAGRPVPGLDRSPAQVPALE